MKFCVFVREVNLSAVPLSAALIAAIEHFQSALRVYTETLFPYEWAVTQNNLGLAYAQRPTGDRGENLRQAIEYYENALRVCTEADFPEDWAWTQFNLSLTLIGLAVETGDARLLDLARVCFEAAARGFAAVGLHEESEMARRLARELGG